MVILESLTPFGQHYLVLPQPDPEDVLYAIPTQEHHYLAESSHRPERGSRLSKVTQLVMSMPRLQTP